MDNWLDDNVKVSYKELFEIISDNEALNRHINGDVVEEIAFSLLLDIYKALNNCSPYDSLIINKLKIIKNEIN